MTGKARITRLLRTSVTRGMLVSSMTLSVAHAQVRSSAHAEVANASSGRMIVVYKNGAIPGDAEARMERAGLRLTRRHDLLGIAIVQGAAKQGLRLLSDPDVAFAIPDRMISAHVMPLTRIAPANDLTRVVLRPAGPGSSRPIPSTPKSSLLPQADTLYSGTPQEWAVKNVGGFGGSIAGGPAKGPWATSTGRGVRIAILDSGVDASHPDIRGNLALNLSKTDAGALPSPCDDGTPQDQQGHGTWVASLAAGAAGANTGDLVGVAPSAVLLNIKVLQRMPGTGSTLSERCANGQASGLMSWVLDGIEEAVAQRADVISMSLGTLVDLTTGDGAGMKTVFDRATHAAFMAGAVVIAAAGNEGASLDNPKFAELPAQARDVLAVVASTNPACEEDLRLGSTCHAGPVSMAYYSNRGGMLGAVAAPGGSYPEGSDAGVSGWVRGACSSGMANTLDGPPADGNHSFGCFNLGHQMYVQAIGTSASAPLVAGVAALVRAAHPTWDAATVLAALRKTSHPLAGTAYGTVDAASAMLFQP